MSGIPVNEIKSEFKRVQDHICNFLQDKSGQKYLEDLWDYDKGIGGGRTRVWEELAPVKGTTMLEKGGVNFSALSGDSIPQSAASKFKLVPGTPWLATGVSLVIHPYNPQVPTIHMNIRYFEAGERWWFGGGVDVTPYYGREAEVVQFHKAVKALCEKHGQDYADMKQQCDEYFCNTHRREQRGVGGIFFDHMSTETVEEARKLFAFVVDLGIHFTSFFEPFIDGGKDLAWGEKEQTWQYLRRGRYVEFNLVHDRGTKFGIQSDGRTESILMSLPPHATWRYCYAPEEGTEEHRTIHHFLQPRDWAAM